MVNLLSMNSLLLTQAAFTVSHKSEYTPHISANILV